ncbi:hypothetical protein [uncultured Sphingomonas sp.]|uniref:hypothetical protein n=1 Tax=uncultured Sphingomonas sp. TaxID=158754 RepID=UPI00260DFBC4|nr:hypothetical protein [uncultured Sphingomonas sp.]
MPKQVRVPIRYDEATGTIRMKWVSPPRPVTDDNGFDAEVTYSGTETLVRRPCG